MLAVLKVDYEVIVYSEQACRVNGQFAGLLLSNSKKRMYE